MKNVLCSVIVLVLIGSNWCQFFCQMQTCGEADCLLTKINSSCDPLSVQNCIEDYYSNKVTQIVKPKNLTLIKAEKKTWIISWDPPRNTICSGYIVILGYGFFNDKFYLKVNNRKTGTMGLACQSQGFTSNLFEVNVEVLPKPEFLSEKTGRVHLNMHDQVKANENLIRDKTKSKYSELDRRVTTYDNHKDDHMRLDTNTKANSKDFINVQLDEINRNSSDNLHRTSIISSVSVAVVIILSIFGGVFLFRYRKTKLCNFSNQEDELSNFTDCPIHGTNEAKRNNWSHCTHEVSSVKKQDHRQLCRNVDLCDGKPGIHVNIQEEEQINLCNKTRVHDIDTEYERRLITINFQ